MARRLSVSTSFPVEIRLDEFAAFHVSLAVLLVQPLAQLDKVLALTGACILRKKLACQAFERGAHHVDRLDLLFGENRNDRAKIGNNADQGFGFELPQGFAYHGARHPIGLA